MAIDQSIYIIFEDEDNFSSSFGFHPCQMQGTYIVQGWNQFHRVLTRFFSQPHDLCLYFRAVVFVICISGMTRRECLTSTDCSYNVGVQMAPCQISSHLHLQQTPDRSACILPSLSRESGNHGTISTRLDIWCISTSELAIFQSLPSDSLA